MKQNYSYYENEGGAPLKLWDTHKEFDSNAMEQLFNCAKLPFIHSHIAGMPDVHWGMGATVGSVIATRGAIVPAAVGVDIGCGMLAFRTELTSHHLPDNLHELRCAIEKAVPHGRTDNGGPNDRGAWGSSDYPFTVFDKWKLLRDRYSEITEKHPGARAKTTDRQLGTLGTGNHFIEMCLDEEDRVWFMLHSGSRGPGNKIGMYFIEKAKEEMRRYYIDKFLPDMDLAYLVEYSEIFDDYLEAVQWAQDYALANRQIMMEEVLNAASKLIKGCPIRVNDVAVNCHHNYVSRENHFDANVLVTRKGAVRARKGDLGIIPGSMGTGSFIVEGLGNPDSFCSCSHGAGRVMSRGQAKKLITMEQHAKAMEGIEARLDADVLDESPAAYKDIGAVMKAQEDLVVIKHRLHQVLNVKG